MKKMFLSCICAAALVACDNPKTEYDQYYEQDYKDSIAAMEAERPTVNQTKVGSDAAVNDMTDSAAAKPATAAAKPNAEYELGSKLIAKSDCLSCHSVNQKVVGPAYKEVAAKYEFNDKNVDYLSQKIIKGGAGVWGEIPMPAHPDLSQKDAEAMAKYILSLKE